MSAPPVLRMFTVYDHPLDYPHDYVVRGACIFPGRVQPDLTPFAIHPSLEAVRDALPPGLSCIPRHPDDDPAVLEVWL
jgi:hypothetical protein